MASGAGSNFVLGYMLTDVTASTTPLSATTALTTYGVFNRGGNDSGGFASEVRGFTKFKFQIIPVGTVAPTGYTISIYGTIDPNAAQTFWYAVQGRTPSGASALPFGGNAEHLGSGAMGYYPGIAPGSWSLLDGVSDQSGTGTSANPLVAGTSPWFNGTGPVVALRAVLTATNSPAGSFSLAVLGIP